MDGWGQHLAPQPPAGEPAALRADSQAPVALPLPPSHRLPLLGESRVRPLWHPAPPWSRRCGLSLGLRGRRAGWDPLDLEADTWGPRHHTEPPICPLSGYFSAADPFDPLLLPSGSSSQPCSKPDLFGELLNSESPATAPASFPSTHSAPPPACSADFLHLGKR